MGSLHMAFHNLNSVPECQNPIENRREARVEFNGAVTIYSPSSGMVPAYALDLSRSGLAVIATADLQVGLRVELDIDLLEKRIRTTAIVRNRSAFRYGFEFLRPEAAIEKVVIARALQD